MNFGIKWCPFLELFGVSCRTLAHAVCSSVRVWIAEVVSGNQVISGTLTLGLQFALKTRRILYGKPCQIDHVYGNHMEAFSRHTRKKGAK